MSPVIRAEVSSMLAADPAPVLMPADSVSCEHWLRDLNKRHAVVSCPLPRKISRRARARPARRAWAARHQCWVAWALHVFQDGSSLTSISLKFFFVQRALHVPQAP
eukprot:scaffold201455_cov36-Tisochrysis_lutea.AAC.1